MLNEKEKQLKETDYPPSNRQICRTSIEDRSIENLLYIICRLTGCSKRTHAGVHKRVSRQDDWIDYCPLSVCKEGGFLYT
jgi:hypothetical protein